MINARECSLEKRVQGDFPIQCGHLKRSQGSVLLFLWGIHDLGPLSVRLFPSSPVPQLGAAQAFAATLYSTD